MPLIGTRAAPRFGPVISTTAGLPPRARGLDQWAAISLLLALCGFGGHGACAGDRRGQRRERGGTPIPQRTGPGLRVPTPPA
ncbi:hypothetical protein ACDT10_16795 [Mycobacterium intracellulare]|uniref:hypothetical protein n=1 Tax=Mycobacterium intracellulare TaxID=1767 RepID=UPI003556E6FC